MGSCWPSPPSVCPPSRRPPRPIWGTGFPLGPVHSERHSCRTPASHSFSRSPLEPFAPPVPSQRASAPAPSLPHPRSAQSACPRPSGVSVKRRARDPFPGGASRVLPSSCRLRAKRTCFMAPPRGHPSLAPPDCRLARSIGPINPRPHFPAATGSPAWAGTARTLSASSFPGRAGQDPSHTPVF